MSSPRRRRAGQDASPQRDEGPSSPTAEAAPRATHPVMLMNSRSGGGKVTRFALADRCDELGVEPVMLGPSDDLLQLAEDAVGRGCDLLGMAGGDGSQALVASVAAPHRIPFVVVPAGTRNHFALDLGVGTDVVHSLSAFVDGVDVRVDLAEINGRVFVNNASMGAYAELVRSPHYRGAKVRTAVELLPDLVGPSAAPVDLRYRLPSGEQATTAQVLLVSNNPYQLSAAGSWRGSPATRRGRPRCGLGTGSPTAPALTCSPRSTRPRRTSGSRGGTSGRRRGSTSRRGNPSPWESTARRSRSNPRCTS